MQTVQMLLLFFITAIAAFQTYTIHNDTQMVRIMQFLQQDKQAIPAFVKLHFASNEFLQPLRAQVSHRVKHLHIAGQENYSSIFSNGVDISLVPFKTRVTMSNIVVQKSAQGLRLRCTDTTHRTQASARNRVNGPIFAVYNSYMFNTTVEVDCTSLEMEQEYQWNSKLSAPIIAYLFGNDMHGGLNAMHINVGRFGLAYQGQVIVESNYIHDAKLSAIVVSQESRTKAMYMADKKIRHISSDNTNAAIPMEMYREVADMRMVLLRNNWIVRAEAGVWVMESPTTLIRLQNNVMAYHAKFAIAVKSFSTFPVQIWNNTLIHNPTAVYTYNDGRIKMVNNTMHDNGKNVQQV